MLNTSQKLIKDKSPLILAEIKKSKNVLLHCHPSPDPDSVCSSLAMKFVLEGMGKEVTLIKGDSSLPLGFGHFAGANTIIPKNFHEVNVNDFDLFIILDSASPEQISRVKPINFPLSIKTIVIDHHPTNPEYADINLVVKDSPATAQILFELFESWGINFTKEIAANLFIGMYSDTGGFIYENVTPRTYEIAYKLISIAPETKKSIEIMDNSYSPTFIYLQGIALSNIETFFGGKLALSLVSFDAIKAKNIPISDVRAGEISPILRSVRDWSVTGTLFAVEPKKVRISFRTQDSNKYDVAKLASVLGGGGHKAASGAILEMTLEEAKNIVVSKAKELYNL